MSTFRERGRLRQGLGLFLLSLLVVPVAAVYATDMSRSLVDSVPVSESLATSLVLAKHASVGDNVNVVDAASPSLVAALRQSLAEAAAVRDSFSNGLVLAIRQSLGESVGVLDGVANSMRAAIRVALSDAISIPDALTSALQTVSGTITTTISNTTSAIHSVPEFGLAVPVLAALVLVAFAILSKRGRSR